MAHRPGTGVALGQQGRLPSFQHERLKLNANSIRLVQIHGSTSKTASLSLRITQYAKHRRPPYAAVSYTWGSSADLRTININGKQFFVHLNLYNLLLHLRQRGESRFLWIDALCIDQANLAERNFHVQLMAQIYDEAATAIVWLGPPSDDRREARAMDFVVEMAGYLDKTKKGGGGYPELYLTDQACPRWNNLLALCYEAGGYWQRCWIIQEFLQARRIEIVCGMAHLDWALFATVFRAMRDHYQSRTVRSVALEDVLRRIMRSIPARLTARRLSSQASPLQDLLHEFYDAECAEPRDKIYGMLGIASDCGEQQETGLYLGPQPDYSKHVLDVYFDVLVHLRDRSRTFSVSPLTTLLLQKSLQISKLDVLEYISKHKEGDCQNILSHTKFNLQPSYMNTITGTIPNWTTVQDLKQRLDEFDWSQYVGFSIARRPRTPRGPASPTPAFSSPARSAPMQRIRSSTARILNTLPKDLFSNVLAVAEVHPALSTLYHYLPLSNGLHLPTSLLTTHHDDKCLLCPSNTPSKPTLIIESSPLAQPLRIGFAPSGTRRGDIVCQFTGSDLTLVVRRPMYGGQSLQLVGRAIMVTHEDLTEKQGEVHPVCQQGVGVWGSSCLSAAASALEGGEGAIEEKREQERKKKQTTTTKTTTTSTDGDLALAMGNDMDDCFAHELLETDGVSMFEILRGGEG